MPPLVMIAVRFLLAGAILYGLTLWRSDSRIQLPTRAQWVNALALGSALLVIGNGGVTLSEQFVPTGIVALIIATSPLWMALIDRVALGQRLSRLGVIGLVVGFLGVALLIGTPGGGHLDPRGAILAVIAPIGWATGSVFSRKAQLHPNPLIGSAMEMLCAGLILAVASVLTGEAFQVHLSAISLTSLLALGWLIIFGSLVAFSAYTWLLRVAPLSLVSTYAYINPVVAVSLGALFLREALSPRILIGGAIIVVAVALIVTSRLRPTS
jgi:drug/metabolite transporter (DMT)-like permease